MNHTEWAFHVVIGVLLVVFVLAVCVIVAVVLCREHQGQSRERARAVVFVPQREFVPGAAAGPPELLYHQ